MKVKLVVRGGKLEGREIPIRTPQFIIGRDESCNLRPVSNMVSKLHCALVAADDVLWARDLKSTNGTFVNGTKIEDRVPLKHGDEIRVGPLSLEVHIADQSSAAQSVKATPKRKPTTEKLDDEVCDWLSEDEVDVDRSDDLSETPTIMDMALNQETVPEMDEINPKPKSANKPTKDKSSAADSSSAASNILQNYFVRKRSG